MTQYHRDLLYWLNTRRSDNMLYIADDSNAEIVLYATMALQQGLIEFDGVQFADMRYRLTDAGKQALGIQEAEDGGSVSRFRLLYIGNTDLDREGFNGEDYKIVTKSGDFVAFARDEVSAYGILADKHENYSLEVNLPTATPQPASEETGYTVREYGNGYGVTNRNGDVLFRSVLEERSSEVASILNTETRSLRDQLATAQAAIEHSDNSANMNAKRVIDLQAALAEARERVSELQKRIQDARYIVGDMPNHPHGIDQLYDSILDLSKPYTD